MSVFLESMAPRVIDRLREHWPSEKWTWDAAGRCWRSSAGRRVYSRAVLAPQHPGGDDTYTVRYYMEDDRCRPVTIERVFGASDREGRLYRD